MPIATCNRCMNFLNENALINVLLRNGTRVQICADCIQHYHHCNDCHNYVQEIYDVHNGNQICRHCYEQNYFLCDECDSRYHNDDYHSDGCCIYCMEDEDNEVPVELGDAANAIRAKNRIKQEIQNTLVRYDADPLNYIDNTHSFLIRIKKEPKILVSGIEVEVASQDPYQGRLDAIKYFKEQFRGNGCIKHDGSIKDARGGHTGFEIVSIPMLMNEHREYKGWHTLLEKAPELLHVDSGKFGAGIHIHLNRNAFDESSLTRFIAFVHNRANYNFIKDIAEREENVQYATLAEKNPCIHYYDDYQHKYQAVRLNKASTIELRIFNSILKPTNFFKNIDFVYALYDYCSSIKDNIPNLNGNYKIFLAEQNNKAETFVNWVSDRADKYPSLYEFLKEKGYIKNELKAVAAVITPKNKKPVAVPVRRRGRLVEAV